MDPNPLAFDPRQLAGPIAALAAAGTGVTMLTEVAKQYVDPRIPPPLIAALVAALFTAAFQLSSADSLTAKDAFPILMTWLGLFQASIAVYHGSKFAFSRSQQARLEDAVAEATRVIREHYDARLDEKERALEHLRDNEILRTAAAVPPEVPEPPFLERAQRSIPPGR